MAREEPLPDQDPHRLDTVTPGELFARLAAACLVADRYLEGPDTAAQQLPGDLGFHAESGLLDAQFPVQRRGYQLETGLQVADVAVEQNISESGYCLVTEDVEIRIGIVTAKGPGAVNDLGIPGEDR